MNQLSKVICSLDLETEPESADVLANIEPTFEAPANWKDPVKIAENVRMQRAKWLERAALDPRTGRVLAAGYQFYGMPESRGGIVATKGDGDEKRVLERIAELLHDAAMGSAYIVVGFGLFSFDLPFFCRRAWKYGIRVPQLRAHRNWLPFIVDVRDIWTFGDRTGEGTLAELATHFGLRPKVGNGAFFAELWNNPETRPQAIAYLQRDLELPVEIGARMGLWDGEGEGAPAGVQQPTALPQSASPPSPPTDAGAPTPDKIDSDF